MPPGLLWRRTAPVTVDETGRLVPTGGSGVLEPATGEALLHRDLAALNNAGAEEVAAFASRRGVLRRATVSLPELEPSIELMLGELLREWRQDLEHLRRWVAAGGAAPIPGRYAPLAVILGAIAELSPADHARISRYLTGSASRVDEVLLTVRGWAALTKLARRSAEVIALRELGDHEVTVRRPDSVDAVTLRLAFNIAVAALERGSEHIAAVRGLPHGWLADIAAQFTVTKGMEAFPLGEPDRVEDWRAAADELRWWREARHLLHMAPRHYGTKAVARQRALRELRARAGFPAGLEALAESRSPKPTQFRAELTTILKHRLEQEGAWPRPDSGVPVATMARALWSIWPHIAQMNPPRVCGWDGCGQELPVRVPVNRRYCEAHRAEAARERAARTYRRRKSASTVTTVEAR